MHNLAKKDLPCKRRRAKKTPVMNNHPSATDEFLLQELGTKLARARLAKNLTQAQLAAQAGIAPRTLSRIERGSGASLVSAFIRVCRALGLLGRFMAIVPDPAPSPMEQLRMHGRQRRRASGRRLKNNTPAHYPQHEEEGENSFLVAEAAPATKWKWGDES